MACLGKKRQHLAQKPNSSFFNGFSAEPFEMLRISFYSSQTCSISLAFLKSMSAVSDYVLLLVWSM